MVKDGQVRMLMRLMNREKTLATAAAKAGMSERTARKYRRLGNLAIAIVRGPMRERSERRHESWPRLT